MDKVEYTSNSSSHHQRDSSEAPSNLFEDCPLLVNWSQEEEATIAREVCRIKETTVICRILGARPSRGELRHLIQARLTDEIDNIISIQILGKGFYHLEMENTSSVTRLLASNPLDLNGSRAFFSPWKHGFSVEEAITTGEKLYPIHMFFPSLPPEFVPHIGKLGSLLGMVLEEKNTMASMLKKIEGIPAVKILVTLTTKFPKGLLIPLMGGEILTQRVEFTGLPNQCFICRGFGHLAKTCPRRKDTPTQQGMEPNQGNPQQKAPTTSTPQSYSEGGGSNSMAKKWIMVNSNTGKKTMNSLPMSPQQPVLFNHFDVLTEEYHPHINQVGEACTSQSEDTSEMEEVIPPNHDPMTILVDSKISPSLDQVESRPTKTLLHLMDIATNIPNSMENNKLAENSEINISSSVCSDNDKGNALVDIIPPPFEVGSGVPIHKNRSTIVSLKTTTRTQWVNQKSITFQTVRISTIWNIQRNGTMPTQSCLSLDLQLCGATVSHDPCMIRLHLLLTTARGEEAFGSARTRSLIPSMWICIPRLGTYNGATTIIETILTLH